jgi:4-carboxymuconolactone decarboxylase
MSQSEEAIVSIRRPTKARISPSPEAVEKAREISTPANVIATMATHHDRLYRHWLSFHATVLLGFEAPRRERELVILRMGWNCQSVYEFGQHTFYARDLGVLTDEEIYSLTRPLTTYPWSDQELTLLQMTDDLYANDAVTDEVWAELERGWTTKEVIEFVVTATSYRMTCGILNTFGVELDEGMPGWPTAPPA